MKLKLILSAALIAGVISAQAATANTSTLSVTNSATALTAASVTNSADPMATLFGDPVIVKANNFQIKRSDLDQILSGVRARAMAQGQQLPQGVDLSILNQLVVIQLLLQKATDADRAAGQKESDDQFAKLVKQFGSEDALKRQMTAVGMTVDQLRAKATQEATAKAALKRELNVSVSDAEVQEYYSNHTADFEEPEMVHVRHILLLTMDPATREPLSTNTIAAKRKQIDDLLKRVKSGEDFAKLATQYSEDPGSKENGGELPEFPRGQMTPEFEAAAFALNTNQISDVITSPYGFHIIKLLDKKPAHMLKLTDTLPGSDDITVAQDVKDGLTQIKIKKAAPAYINGLRKEQNVQILDATLNAEQQAMDAAETNAPAAAADDGSMK